MSKRYSDTVAIAGLPLGAEVERTQRVRKIDNGYLTCDSEYNPSTGSYKSSEKFSESPPKGLGMNSAPRGTVGDESLSDTKTYMGSDV